MRAGRMGAVARLMAGLLVLAVLLMPAARFAAPLSAPPDRHLHTAAPGLLDGAHDTTDQPCRGHATGDTLPCCAMAGCVAHAVGLPTSTDAAASRWAAPVVYLAGITPLSRGLATPPALHPPRPII